MAKKIRFPLDMGNGVEVRTLEELQENFSLEKVLGYYTDGKLVMWLRDRYMDDIADALEGLDKKALDFSKKICEIFSVEYSEDGADIKTIEERNQKLALLKEYTEENRFIDVIDDIAFNQDDLYDLLDEDKKIIYLCGDKFSIPLGKSNVKYVGINHPIVIINSKEIVNWQEKKIELVDVCFDNQYGVIEKKAAEKESVSEYYTMAYDCIFNLENQIDQGKEYLRKVGQDIVFLRKLEEELYNEVDNLPMVKYYCPVDLEEIKEYPYEYIVPFYTHYEKSIIAMQNFTNEYRNVVAELLKKIILYKYAQGKLEKISLDLYNGYSYYNPHVREFRLCGFQSDSSVELSDYAFESAEEVSLGGYEQRYLKYSMDIYNELKGRLKSIISGEFIIETKGGV